MTTDEDPKPDTAPHLGSPPPDSEIDEWQELADQEPHGGRGWWLLAVAVMVATVVTVIALWPRGETTGTTATPTSAAASASAATSADPGLMAGQWPAQAIAALQSDTQVTEVTRLLFTPEQVQATGRTAEDSSQDAWTDYLYVEDRAISLGTALIEPDAADAFELDSVDGDAIATLVADAADITGIAEPTVVQVIVERDTVDAAATPRIEMYVSADDVTTLVTADLAGTVLSVD